MAGSAIWQMMLGSLLGWHMCWSVAHISSSRKMAEKHIAA